MIARIYRMVLPLACVSAPLVGGAPLRVDITEGVGTPLQLAVATVSGGRGPGGFDNFMLANIIGADLETTGRYQLVAGANWLDAGGAPAFSRYQAKGIQALVVARSLAGAGIDLRYECALYDVYGQSVQARQQIVVRLSEWRRAAHKCADAVFEQTTGVPGHFDTRLVYVARERRAGATVRRLAIMDYDGENRGVLSVGNAFVAMPRFATNGRNIIVSVIEGDVTRLRVLDTGSGRFRDIPAPPEQAMAPRVSPDGRAIVFSMATDGESDIYRLELASGAITRLTNTPGHDTSPSYSPDGRFIAFESTRSGKQQIYVMAADGSGQKRISFGDLAYASPVWSPREDVIAFTRIGGGGTQIGLMRSDGSRERIVSGGKHDEGPSWAPSGRALAFERAPKAGAEREVWITDISGRFQHRVALPWGASDISWSGRLP